jgi:hypothetical protein
LLDELLAFPDGNDLMVLPWRPNGRAFPPDSPARNVARAVWQQAFIGLLPGKKAHSDIKRLGSRSRSTIRAISQPDPVA